MPISNNLFYFRTSAQVKEVFKAGQDPANFQWGSLASVNWNHEETDSVAKIYCGELFFGLIMKNDQSF